MPFSLILSYDDPLVGVDAQSLETVYKIPHLFLFLSPLDARPAPRILRTSRNLTVLCPLHQLQSLRTGPASYAMSLQWFAPRRLEGVVVEDRVVSTIAIAPSDAAG